nr:hypothetical protein CFP56_24323 [Quercus suber]
MPVTNVVPWSSMTDLDLLWAKRHENNVDLHGFALRSQCEARSLATPGFQILFISFFYLIKAEQCSKQDDLMHGVDLQCTPPASLDGFRWSNGWAAPGKKTSMRRLCLHSRWTIVPVGLRLSPLSVHDVQSHLGGLWTIQMGRGSDNDSTNHYNKALGIKLQGTVSGYILDSFTALRCFNILSLAGSRPATSTAAMVYSLAYRRPPQVAIDYPPTSSSPASSRPSVEEIRRSIDESIKSTSSSCMSQGIPQALSFDRIVSGGTCPVGYIRPRAVSYPALLLIWDCHNADNRA